ncbi:branched-chain amino acid ABC transporter permease [Kerstersia gyiorum]|uniref:branched-chain amino acid ABC transporter permease n=1 Tax=Kerstersia gyiorum TaxID=206506 RepID=UPI003B42B6B6
MNSSTSLSPALALRRQGAWRLWEAPFWLAVFLLPWLASDYAMLINEIAIVALFALSLDLILGYAGIVSLGHAAFFGMGAYSAGLFALHVSPDPLLGLAFGTVCALLLGLLFSPSIMRGTDLSRLMVTIGVTLILYELANQMAWLTGGADGLQGIFMGPLFGAIEFDFYGQTAAWYSITVLLLMLTFMRVLVNSPFGATLQAVRDNPLRASAIGIPVAARLAVAYTLSAGMAGMAGSLLAQTNAFVSLDVFDFARSADVVLILVIGGAGWLYGGIFGAIVFKLMHDVLSAITPQYWMFWLGLFLVLLTLVGRDRLLRPWTLLRRPGKRASASNAAGETP